MAKYDDASWHYGGDFPEDLENEAGATHIGMFITWCINNNLVSEFQMDEAGDDVQKVKDRLMTGTEFLISNCDEKFTDEDLNEVGNQFANAYYNEDTQFAKSFAPYLQDYSHCFEQRAIDNKKAFKSVYHVKDSWENYALIEAVIDKRFGEWKKIQL